MIDPELSVMRPTTVAVPAACDHKPTAETSVKIKHLSMRNLCAGNATTITTWRQQPMVGQIDCAFGVELTFLRAVTPRA